MDLVYASLAFANTSSFYFAAGHR